MTRLDAVASFVGNLTMVTIAFIAYSYIFWSGLRLLGFVLKWLS